MNKNSKIYVAGHTGLVGSAIIHKLAESGYTNLLYRTIDEMDLTNQAEVDLFFKNEKPDYVFLAAAKVGGIMANSTYPADFIFQNMAIALNVIHSAYKYGVKKLINLGSSCIYPKNAPLPLKEEYLLSGFLEPTNEAYAIAKISAIKLCKYYNEQYKTNFLSAMPTNLYGPGDNYDLENSHVLPAMIRKIYEGYISKSKVVLWGDGSPLREFLFSTDLADALIFLMEKYDSSDIGEFINIGSGDEVSMKELSNMIKRVLNFDVDVEWDLSKPNGTPRKLLDTSRLTSYGWKPKIKIEEGIGLSYLDFVKRYYPSNIF
ncbi:MAG: GDP-fucose synthetase [Spirochaetae bacterium HGW-Spirochaetae-5]|nr:MAG: GDP-fucose synthetase [Spirochaetae bacterium HGW-Spirochaetae-5]